MSSSSIVIKVKFKKTLRRFIASVEDEDEKVAIDVVMLREKIRGFFGFDSGVEFTMTYVDEDGDNVTLVDDDDLLDIVQQSLDPLRITVKLIKSKPGVSSKTSSSLKSAVPSKGAHLNVPDIPNQPWLTTINATTSVDKKSTGKSKEAPHDVEKKEHSNSAKKKETQPMNPMVTKTPFTFSQRYDSGSSSGMFEATNQNPFVMPPKNSAVLPNYEDYYINYTPSTVNNGVRCNACGVTPLTGVWFMSKVKENENLCRSCMNRTGMQSHFSRPYDPFLHIPLPTQPQALKNSKSDVFGSKLSSDFLLDVTIPDGTIMAPSTKFTKVWRMLNDGSIVWPQGTQLQWNHGNRLGSANSVNVEIPLFGLGVDQELDIAVNFIAPELPGRYASYWRMASPSGQKFGQLIWVMIKVDASVKESDETLINLNLPPAVKNPDEVVNHVPENNLRKVTDSDATSVDSKANDQEMIKADASLKESGETSINLNLPPVMKNPDEVVNQDPENNLSEVTYSYATSVDSKANDQEMNLPIYESVIDDNEDDDEVLSNTATFSPAAVEAMKSPVDTTKLESALSSFLQGLDTTKAKSSLPEVVNQTSSVAMDSSVMAATFVHCTPSSSSTVPAVQPSSSSSQNIIADQEQMILEDLKHMGFDQVDLKMQPSSSSNQDITADQEQMRLEDLGHMGFDLVDLNMQPSSSSSQVIIADREQMLLEDLERMGFQPVDLNKKILRRNNYDMEKSIDDLCDISEWDPILSELEEMGFVDEEVNRELLKKNNGSVSHVVMDLIYGKGQ